MYGGSSARSNLQWRYVRFEHLQFIGHLSQTTNLHDLTQSHVKVPATILPTLFLVLTSSVDKAPLFCLDGTIASEDDPVKICKLLDGSNSGNDKTSFGAITLAASAEKPSSFLRGYSLTFYLQEGMVILCINGAYKKFLKSGGCFIVPDGNSYELKNVGKVPAKLVFFTLKDDDSLT
ncbi:uncharacterized protein [Watersipora subatra]|uniref:uncharacterized protein n=1 Tax=Watersipora subatra TaxID=2589382 RepID=UPI00355B9B5F